MSELIDAPGSAPDQTAAKPSIEDRIRTTLSDMENDKELAAALDAQFKEMQTAIPNPQFVDPGEPPEILEMLAKDPFILSRFVSAEQ